MVVDLHVHTDISDGACDLHETLKLAKANGVTHIAITNHDTVKGLAEAMKEGDRQGIKVIPGVEISAQNKENGKKVHILGYYFDLEGQNIKKLCNPLLERRHENSLWQIDQLLALGYQIDLESILEKAKNSGVIYKQHIMDELIQQNYTDGIYSDLYKKLFKNGGPCAKDIDYVDALDAVRAIKADGGIAVLAHPGQLDSYDLIDSLVEVGLDGIELYHEDHTQADIERVLEFRKKHDLLLTGGTDFHGSYGTHIQVGDLGCPEAYVNFFTSDPPLADLETSGHQVFMERLIKKAGARLREVVKDEMSLKYKDSYFRDIVTKYDVEIEDFLMDQIRTKYPEHSFITEESKSNKQEFTDYTWIIDPIDGTTNFVSLGKDFTISLALYKHKKPYIGMVYDVMKDVLYCGIIGKGAFENGKPIVKAKSTHSLKDSLVDISLHSIYLFEKEKNIPISNLIKFIRGHRAYGSASLALCRIAKGEIQAYISASLNLWDYAAAVIILEELGGCYHYLDEKSNEEFPLESVAFIAVETRSILNELNTIAESASTN